jgi:uncharacterized membrane protein
VPHSTSRGPWEAAATPDSNGVPTIRDTHSVLLHAVIRPNRAGGQTPDIILAAVAVIAVGLSLAFLLRGEWIVAVLFGVELSALTLATRAWRRQARRRREELRLYPDRLEVRTFDGDQVTTDHLPTAWLTIEPPRKPAPSGIILCAAQRRVSIGRWLGAAQRDDLRQTLETTLALARRGGLAAATAPTRTWSSQDALRAPVDPAGWAGGAGQS